MVFALFNVIWSTLFLEEWKRRGAELAYKWGTLDSPGEAVEEPRPQFRVSWGLSPGSWRQGKGKWWGALQEQRQRAVNSVFPSKSVCQTQVGSVCSPGGGVEVGFEGLGTVP